MMEIFPLIVTGALLLGFSITYLIQNKILEMITQAEFIRPNFKNNLIPVGSGVIFPASLALGYIPLLFIWPEKQLLKAFIFIFVITFATFLGLIDDFWGSRDTSGLKGHLGSLLNGHVTTGGFKAVGGGVISLLAAAVSEPLAMIPVNTLLLALSINAINLLDLRPGRAGKSFILGAILLGMAGKEQQEIVLMALLLGSLLAFLPLDLKAKTMMGDAGSNALGACLGVMAIWLLVPKAKFILLGFLIFFHLLTERYSLTQLIAKNRFLNFLDTLGREK